MEQPKKPAPTRDISDLKARLGLKPAAAPAAAPMPGRAPTPAPSPSGGMPMPGAAPSPFAAPAPAAVPAGPDPYAALKPPPGRQFDLRPVDDGVPAVNVRDRGGKGGLVIGLILATVGAGIGFGFGSSNVGRRFHNQANAAAKTVKAELEEMQKTVSQIGTAVAMSQQRMQASHQDPVAYDAKLVEDLEKVKLDPRPDTARIFKVNYYLLSDVAVDRLMSYYYDSIALYGEVERHIKRTKADAESLASYAGKQAQKGGNYGVVFDNAGRFMVANLVEVGKPVCKGGGEECGADAITGFQIRANTGANWSPKDAGAKLLPTNLVPLKPTPLMEAVMSGSPEQVRMEAYRQRTTNIRIILARLTATQKELKDAVDKAAARPDLFTF